MVQTRSHYLYDKYLGLSSSVGSCLKSGSLVPLFQRNLMHPSLGQKYSGGMALQRSV